MNKYEEKRNRIREEVCGKINDKKAKLVFSSSFTAEPQFEEEYLDDIEKNDYLFSLYKKWILNLSPYPFPKDPDLYNLRSIILKPIEKKKLLPLEVYKYIDRPVFYLLLDFLNEFFEGIVAPLDYYFSRLSKGDQEKIAKDLEATIEATLVQALTISDKEANEKEGYTTFVNAWMDKSKFLLFKNLKLGYLEMPEDNKLFIKSFKEEWEKLYPFSDLNYGFSVVPLIDHKDWFKLLKLPFDYPELKSVLKSKFYRELMNYVVAFATVKPVPVLGLKIYFREQLLELFKPLIKNQIIKAKWKGNQFVSDSELEKILNEKFNEMVTEFQFFYKPTQEIQKKDFKGQTLLAPVGFGGQFADIGNIYDNNQYPFTAYIKEKLINLLNNYFEKDFDNGSFSLMDDDLVDVWDKNYIPDYDFIDKNGNKLGWQIKTFCGIIGKSDKTLRRWDKEKLLGAKRYGFCRKFKSGKYQYRYYTRDDIDKAKLAKEVTLLRKQHRA
jgi:hypothetical protein